MRCTKRSKAVTLVVFGAFFSQLLTTMVPAPAYARVDPLNVIVRQLHKPNMLIMLASSGTMTGVPGGLFDYTKEVGVDCNDGQSCRGGISVGVCSATDKACSGDFQCRAATCKSGSQPCTTDSNCSPIPGTCDTGETCLATADCPAPPDGSCAFTGAICSLTQKCSTRLRCTRTAIACAGDVDCKSGTCADNMTACNSTNDCPYSASNGTCQYGATPSGGCSVNSDCPLRAKVCTNNSAIACVTSADCGICEIRKTACKKQGDCPGAEKCIAGGICTNPANVCVLPRQACTTKYTDNRCVDTNTCVPKVNNCNGVTANRCAAGVDGDTCNAPHVSTGVRMCRTMQTLCDEDRDCTSTADSCGPASSRMTVAKRVLRNIVSANANVVNLGLMTYYQKGYFPYYPIPKPTTTTTGTVNLHNGALHANKCYTKQTGLEDICVVDGATYKLRGGNNTKYLIKAHGATGADKYVDAPYCGWFCDIDGVGTGVFSGAYYDFVDVQGDPGEMQRFDTYMGKTFTDASGVTWRYYDAAPDYYNGGTPPPIDVVPSSCNVSTSTCSASCGARWDTQLSPFLTADDSPANLDRVIGSINQALEPASYGGIIAYGNQPVGCSLLNDQAPDRNHSAYHYMRDVKAADSLQCRLNYVLLITDGEANGPSDYNCGGSACSADDPLAAGCTCRAVLNAYKMRKDLGVRTMVVGFSTNGSIGSGMAANNNIAKAGGTDVGNDAKAPYAYAAQNERALQAAIQDAIYTAVQGSYATSPSTASQGAQQGTSYASGNYVLDSRVDFPSWRGHLIAYQLTDTGPVLKWDAATRLESMDWKRRRVFTSDNLNNMMMIDVDPSSGAIRNADKLYGLGLGGSVAEAEQIARWMLGDPALNNPAVLGAIINSTPVDVGPPIDGPLPGQGHFHETQKDRPHITYVGSNDGMLHAFFTQDVSLGGSTYAGGSEAFAYLPPNMMRMVTKLYAQGGQLADPKQHIYGGLANSPKVKTLCVSNCDSDTAAVWKTLLVVTQGWGGNEVFMLDVTTPMLQPNLYWSSIMQGWPAAYDRALGLTVSVPAFTFHKTDGHDDYRLLLASGYKVDPNSTTQGRTFLSVSVVNGTVMDEEVLPGSGWCPQEYTLLADVATSRKQFTNTDGVFDGRKEFLTAYVGDTWGKLWRYGPDSELIYDFGCQQPLHYSPTIVQLDADDPNNPNGGDTYLVQVTNSSLDDDTKGFAPSKMIIIKETNASGRPVLDTSYGVEGKIELSTNDPSQLCGVTDATGTSCLQPLPSGARPLSTPMAIIKGDGTGFFLMSNWYSPAVNGCGKGATYFLVHEVSAGNPVLKQASKVADEPVLSPVIVGGKLMISSSSGPMMVDASVTMNIVNARPPAEHNGDVFQSGGWTEVQ